MKPGRLLLSFLSAVSLATAGCENFKSPTEPLTRHEVADIADVRASESGRHRPIQPPPQIVCDSPASLRVCNCEDAGTLVLFKAGSDAEQTAREVAARNAIERYEVTYFAPGMYVYISNAARNALRCDPDVAAIDANTYPSPSGLLCCR